jgi:hypothetical protein
MRSAGAARLPVPEAGTAPRAARPAVRLSLQPGFGLMCLGKGDLYMTAVYRNRGLHFAYPEGWELEESHSEPSSVTVHSPGGAFWSITRYPVGTPPADLIGAAISRMRQEYQHLDSESATETLQGRQLVGCNLNFFHFDLTSTAVFRSFRDPRGTYLIYYQAEDREFDALEDVFRAITISALLPDNAPD